MYMIKKVRKHLEEYLSEFVYGGIDGSVTTFAVVAGATGAHFGVKVLLVLGFANLVADGISMGVGSYLSTKSEQELMVKKGKSIKDEPSPIINGVTTYISFLIVGFIPLLSYTIDVIFKLELDNLFPLAIGLTAMAFIGIGLLKSRVAQTNVARAVAETLILGALAASASYLLGDVLEKLLT